MSHHVAQSFARKFRAYKPSMNAFSNSRHKANRTGCVRTGAVQNRSTGLKLTLAQNCAIERNRKWFDCKMYYHKASLRTIFLTVEKGRFENNLAQSNRDCT